MPLVSIVIPARDRRKLLLRAVESVSRQTYLDWELVIIDDGSVDPLCLDELPDQATLVRSSSSMGVAAARNRGVEASIGEWVCFLDSDDEWETEKLAVQCQWHDQHPEFSISQVREEWIWNGAVRKKPKEWEPPGGDLFASAVSRCSIGPSCVMMRRELFNEAGGFDERFAVCEDYDLWLRITTNHPVGKVEGPSLVRKHGGHSDQLSASVPAMDRFRIASLLSWLREAKGSEEQGALVHQEIGRKAGRVAEGARKRSLLVRAALYHEIHEGIQEAEITNVDRWCRQVWEEIQA